MKNAEVAKTIKSKILVLSFLIVFVGMGSNCSAVQEALSKALGFKLLESDSDMTAKTPSGWTFLFGLSLNEDVADNLFSEGGSLEVPGLGTVLGAAASAAGLDLGNYALVAAKEVKHDLDNKTYLNFIFMVKVNGDTIEAKPQDGFPVLKGEGNYGFYLAAGGAGFVKGLAKDCSGTPKSGLWVNNKYFISKTDSQGRYALPGVGGEPMSIAVVDTDCNGNTAVATSASPSPSTDDTGNDKDLPANEETTPVAQGDGVDEKIATEDTPSPREPNVTGDNACGKLYNVTNCGGEFVIVRKDGKQDTGSIDFNAPSLSGNTDSASIAFADFNGGTTNNLFISTGGSSRTKGTAAIIRFKASNKTKATISYRLYTQEYSKWSLGNYNDAVGILFVGDVLPAHVTTVKENHNEFIGYSSGELWIGDGTIGNSSSDAYGSSHNGNPSNKWSGYVSKTVTVDLPSSPQPDGYYYMVIGIADVGDMLYDSAIAIERIDFFQ